MRIVAGQARGTKLEAPKGVAVRPTSDRARQALFNVLDGGRFGESYTDRLVLDAFAGTGALGLEALSRGAREIVFVETDSEVLAGLRRNIQKMRVERDTTVILADATTLTRRAPEAAGLVLMDPPYRAGLAGPAVLALAAAGWIDADTLVVVETASKGETFETPEGFTLIEARKYGAAMLHFLKQAP
ncbi:MAG: 16S rRNA (guanine(966)-N(2))-methyltransferase RsmD [Rhodospirillaceae bacterium]|jgi:16S rRNA (guanine966-N2)-methyltransferase|nr:16S rRNA (guanine(966)-N(2))-methyltransferase RsmD [Rhodospirillaceae bacterium]MBT6136327.1 16S rRNA (guanine(966)-N(2))-methyltransferase RsmD [Rhodospirillaceae bacterium]